MKKQYIAISFLALSLLGSCIEEYNVVMEDPDNEILVVEGEIVGGTECEFILQFSTCHPDGPGKGSPNIVKFANVEVVCSDGEVYEAQAQEDWHYYVRMGELDPEKTYHVRIQLASRSVYESEPLHPLPSPAINHLAYTMSDDGETVQLRLTNDDPHAQMYYLWTYDEHWEINTPLVTEWRYDRSSNSIQRLRQRIDRGWCHQGNHPVLLGSNINYGNGAIQDHVLYTLSNLDHRFNTRYHTKVRQLAITKGEYEYYQQMSAQSAQTGGIFTLMPAQLPTNIHNNRGHKVAGYIGVHLNSSDADIYINRTDVGYKETRSPEIITDSLVRKETWLGALYDRGYRIFHYYVYNGDSEWTKPWCIDCRDPYWGAELERPDFWEDN